MSLINDALNRAKQAQKDNPPPSPALEFKAADPSQSRGSGPPILLIVAIIVVLALVGVFVVIGLQKRGTGQPVANVKQPNETILQTAAPSVGPPAENSVPETGNPHAAPANAPSSAFVAPKVTTNTTTFAGSSLPPTNSATNVSVAAVDVPPVKPELPKLQGIFYRPARPSAVINGKNVFIGSRVGEFKVLSITQENVTIGSATQTNVLSLAE